MIKALASAVVGGPLAASGQGPRSATIGWVATARIPSNMLAFRQALKELGYTDGQNVLIEERYASARPHEQLVAELVRLKVDVLVTTGGVGSKIAKAATGSIPIVFLASDPVGAGLVSNLSRPGGNLTGAALVTHDFNTKRVETIAGLIPRLARVGLLGDASGALTPAVRRAFLHESDTAAKRLGLQVIPIELKSIDDVDDAFAQAVKAGAEAMIGSSSSYFNGYKDRLVAAAANARLPTIFEHRDFVEAGGLLSYGPDLRVAFAIAASYVDKILKGARPGDLPVQQVSKVELVINRRAARELKLTIPPALLIRADEVID
jgi:putative ABC transport system substrate-binding protein